MWNKMEWILLGFPLCSVSDSLWALWLVCILLSSLISLQLKHIAAGANWFSMSFVLRVFYIIYFVALWYVVAEDKMCLSLHFFPPHVLGNEFLWLFAVFCTLFWRLMCLRLFILPDLIRECECVRLQMCVYFLIAFFPANLHLVSLVPLENHSTVKHPQRPDSHLPPIQFLASKSSLYKPLKSSPETTCSIIPFHSHLPCVSEFVVYP